MLQNPVNYIISLQTIWARCLDLMHVASDNIVFGEYHLAIVHAIYEATIFDSHADGVISIRNAPFIAIFKC